MTQTHTRTPKCQKCSERGFSIALLRMERGKKKKEVNGTTLMVCVCVGGLISKKKKRKSLKKQLRGAGESKNLDEERGSGVRNAPALGLWSSLSEMKE